MRSPLRIAAFARGETVSTMRQPRLLLLLILGPFLVLFLFGLGYDERVPRLDTVVVGGDDELTARVDAFLQDEQPGSIEYQGASADREQALEDLRSGQVDLVIVLPPDAAASLRAGEHASIEVHHRSLDPVTSEQIAIASDVAVAQINDQVLEEVLAVARRRSGEVEDDLTRTRQQLAALREAVDDGDLVSARDRARQLAPRLEALSAAIEDDPFVGVSPLLGGPEDLPATLRSTAAMLDVFAETDGAARLDETEQTLAELEMVVATLQDVDPVVAARPFALDLRTQTPVPIALDTYFAPGVLALMLQHLGVTFAALALVRERRPGTLEVLRVAPATVGERLAGKTLAFLLLGALAAAGLTALIVAVFAVPLPAHWLTFVALLALTVVASIGIGFLVAAVSRSDSQAVQIAMLLLLATIFFSGLFMPLERIGFPMRWISYALPATHGFLGAQDLMLLQQPTHPNLFVALGILAVLAFTAARLLLPRRTEAV
ncbi:ABC transporter permease [Egicoccus halophilus]|uniref:Transport permease protein n=1 Tax=Egicoccus halophilus TaxID=1670830 RepID=A0A8J3AG30_9ACTN|nr:ABC transporter permease [Egicoccus halophilus]GGI08528.1 hypothetical protein GCM10011354_29530 [Egicoccus halophilus]